MTHADSWDAARLTDMLSGAAGSLGAINPTEAGTAPRSALGVAATQHASPISLGAGIPDPDALPAADLSEAFAEVLATSAPDALRYGGVYGSEDLRRVLAERQGRIEGLDLTPGHFMVTNGSSAAIDVVCAAFINPGDVVVSESPAFAGSLRTFRGHLAELASVSLTEEGSFAGRVEQAILTKQAEGKRVKLLYTVADFSNPVGSVLPLQDRHDLLDVCGRHGVLILEDAAYTEVWFNRPPPPSLYALSEGYGVVRAGSFSKVMATGLRVGWVQALPPVIEACSRVRFDMGGSPLFHKAVAHYVESGRFEQHVQQMRTLYAAKCEALAGALEEHCTPYLQFERPSGGYFLWATCLSAENQRVVQAAAAEGVTFAPGSAFQPGNTSHVRLAFSYATLAQTEEAGRRLRTAFRGMA